MNKEYKKLILMFVVQVVAWEILGKLGVRIDSPVLTHFFIAIAYAPLIILAYKAWRNPRLGGLIRFISIVACVGIIIAWCTTFVFMLTGRI